MKNPAKLIKKKKKKKKRHIGEHVTGSSAMYITNGDGVLGDSLLVHFTDILDV